MLELATYYESQLGRNDGNPLYVTAFLKRMQYYADVATKRSVNEKLLRYFPLVDGKRVSDPLSEALTKELLLANEPDGLIIEHVRPYGDLKPYGKPEYHIWVDWGEDALKGILPYEALECPKPMIYWASDTHINNGAEGDSYPYRLSMAKRADIVFVAQKAAVEKMKADGVPNPIWLPHAVEPLAYPKITKASKVYDICFVGHVNSQNRIDALDRLFSEFSNFYYGQKRFEEAAKIYGDSKIVFNISMTDDINMRTFEAMATGSFLLTNWIPTIEDLFEDGKHLVLYRTLDEMVDKAKYYLSHDDEREKIAQAGYEEVIKNHTFKNRVGTMLTEIFKHRGAVCV